MENKRDTGGKRLIVVSSVTYALKSRDLLFQRGIKAYIERLPRTRESGCGYGVYVPQRTDEAERHTASYMAATRAHTSRKVWNGATSSYIAT